MPIIVHRHYQLGRVLLAALLAMAPALRAQSGGRGLATAPERFFYYVDSPRSYDSFVQHASLIDAIGPQVYTMDSLGIVFGTMDSRVLAIAKSKNVKVMPLVVNEGFQQAGLHRLLGDTVAQARAVSSFVALCKSNGYWGIQFDIENINVQDRDRFTAFYARAAGALHAAGFAISVAAVVRSADDEVSTGYGRFMQDSWRGAFDFASLGRIGDFVSLMTYDQHTRRTTPGPVAELGWMRAATEFTLRSVPPDKVSFGVPLYGRHWFTRYDAASPDRANQGSASISATWGKALAERAGGAVTWDPVVGESWGHFNVGGQWEWVFLEDARALNAKLELMRSLRVRGFSAWVLGDEDPAIWELLRR